MKAHITNINLLTVFLVISLIGLTAEATVFAQAFAPPVNYTVGSNPRSCALGDLNGDGKQDIVVANNSSHNISVLLGIGDGTFGAKTDYAAVPGPYALVTVDLNGDGKLDIVAASGGFSGGNSTEDSPAKRDD